MDRGMVSIQRPQQHQVFICFRGAQLRYGVISHLVDGLKRSGINVFIDNQENKGEDIDNLLKRIDESRIAIVVFSSRFTESKYCLWEAERIMERVAQDMLKVLPVFYKVTTTHVSELKGEFGEHFRDREQEYHNNRFVIDKWKQALAFISHRVGLELDERSSESDFIESIVNEVLKLLASIPSTKQTAKSQISQHIDKGETSKSLVKAPEKKLMTQQSRRVSSSAPRANVWTHNVPPNQFHQSSRHQSGHPNIFSYEFQAGPNQFSYSFSTTGNRLPGSTSARVPSSHVSWFASEDSGDDSSDEL